MLEHAATVRFEHFNYNGDRERLEALLNGDIAVGSVDFAAAFSTDRGVLVREGHSLSAHTATGNDLRALGRNWYTIGW